MACNNDLVPAVATAPGADAGNGDAKGAVADAAPLASGAARAAFIFLSPANAY
jgi:hypothetical protein